MPLNIKRVAKCSGCTSTYPESTADDKSYIHSMLYNGWSLLKTSSWAGSEIEDLYCEACTAKIQAVIDRV